MSYQSAEISQIGTANYRVYFYKDDVPVSPVHDIPLWFDKEKRIANMIVEIPRGTRAKLECSKDLPLNPIKQDIKKGALRYVHDPYPFNYGAFPQTWESPFFIDPHTKAKGDNDPLDVVEISGKPKKPGQVVPVKILGTYAMIDDEETDWKIITIDISDPLAEKLDAHTDIPEDINRIVFTYLRDYKIPDGNPPNKFAFNNQLMDKGFALKVVDECHQQWLELVTGKVKGSFNITGLTNGNKITKQQAIAFVSQSQQQKL